MSCMNCEPLLFPVKFFPLAYVHSLIGWPWKINNVSEAPGGARATKKAFLIYRKKRARRKKLQSEPPKGSF